MISEEASHPCAEQETPRARSHRRAVRRVPSGRKRQPQPKPWLVVLLLWGACELPLQAQLAITEAMTWASTNCSGVWRPSNADFWELTNFGPETHDLSDYFFCDRDHPFPDGAWRIPTGTRIAPGESIIFMRSDNGTADAAAFQAWWGEAQVPSSVQVIPYPNRYGFDQTLDAVRLWDSSSNLVDQVTLGEATRGVTFTYETHYGQFGLKSIAGVRGAFQAAEYDDIGSPGLEIGGPVPMQITRQPLSQSLDAGMELSLSVEAYGLPRPRGYQWYHNGVPVPNVHAADDSVPTVVNYAGCGLAWKISPRATDLAISKVELSDAGEYFVVLTNGLERLTSAVVRVTVNSTPSPPAIACPPIDLRFPTLDKDPQTNLTVTPGQTAQFAVIARGFPLPKYQWSRSSDGVTFRDLARATNSMLVIPYVESSYIYRVRLSNSHGTNYAYAGQTVKAPPPLRITEAMSLAGDPERPDWWELTNTGDEPVNIYGYRWDDSPGTIGGGPTITNNFALQPGESVILLEAAAPDEFIRWWGAANLPPGLRFIHYTANGLNDLQDSIRVWNATAMGEDEPIDHVAFSSACPGASFWFDADVCPYSILGTCCSALGNCGAFRAAQGGDLGSPGWTRWTRPCLTSVQRNRTSVTLQWQAQPGSTCLLQSAPAPNIIADTDGNVVVTWTGTATLEEATSVDGPWSTVSGGSSGYRSVPFGRMKFFRLATSADQWADLGTFTFQGATATATHTSADHCSYRVLRVSSPTCPCPEEASIQTDP